jgi:hypothetical protein
VAILTVDHVRALCASSERTALVLADDGPRVVTSHEAGHGLFAGRYRRLLCTRSELLDSRLIEGRDGELVGRTVEVCTAIAADLNQVLAEPHGAADVSAGPQVPAGALGAPPERARLAAAQTLAAESCLPASDRLGDAPVVVWDVDDVLNPRLPTAAHQRHRYDGPGPFGTPISIDVYLNPEHGEWITELSAAGATHAWATSWGRIAADWIAPRLGEPAAASWPVIDVGVHTSIDWGWTSKVRPVEEFLGHHRPVFWIDNLFGGKEEGWAEDRTGRGVPSVIRRIGSPAGLARADIDAALTWLVDVHAARERRGKAR